MASARVQELHAQGEALLEQGKHGEAIKALSDGLKVALDDADKCQLLLTRARASIGMAQHLRQIPASHSEGHAIVGLDSTTLAQLGLNDAKKAAQINAGSTDAHAQQGAAQMLLEKYEEAVAAYLAGLGVDPLAQELQQGLQAARQQLAGSRPSSPVPAGGSAAAKRRRLGAAEDAECVLCMKLYYEPVTTPCGHSFCRGCFLRSLDHSSKCPVCRTVLHVGREIPVTLALRQLLAGSFPDEYEARRREEAGQEGADAGEAPLPLFVMSNMLPEASLHLNFFEPRYRLMCRRVMEGNRRFGMAATGGDGGVGTEVEVIECRPLADGRYLVEIIGRRRFRMQNVWQQDGYKMCSVEYFQDEAPEPGSAEAQELVQVAAAVVEKADTMLVELRRAATAGRVPNSELLELLQHAGERPNSGALEGLSFWVASMLPLTARQTLQMLTGTSTLERLRSELDLLARFLPDAPGCVIA